MSENHSSNAPKQNNNVHYIQWIGAMQLLLALCSYFDIGGLASFLGLMTDGNNQLLGGVLAFVGLLDIIVVPRVLSVKTNPKL